MAFPSIRSQNTTNGTTGSATPVINLPATVVAGDILFAFIRIAVAGAVGWPAGWNEIIDASDDAADDQNAAAWKVADGSEGGTTITLSSGNGKFASFSYSIQDAEGAITPPELSTVATGTTPAQPDATTCTPTSPAGATTIKDYLWITFFGMAGEATGITNYPTNYTLGQTGFANSGTGGATTTNCICVAAGRTNNATSEDAGAWTIAGTLAQWSAWTIAFHPKAPIGSEVSNSQPTKFPTRSLGFLGLGGLTIAVNLLQSTLAPTATPIGGRADDIIRSTPEIRPQWIQSRPQYYQDELLPGKSLSTELPLPNKFPARTWINNNQQNTLARPFYQLDWPVPAPFRKPGLTWVNNNQNDVLAPVASPFSQTEWPNPTRTTSQLTVSINSRPTNDDKIAFNQLDWPNPAPAKLIAKSFTIWPQLETPPNPPFLPIDYPNPKYKQLPNIGFTSARPSYYEELKPFLNDPYPNPLYKGQQNRGFKQDRPQYYTEPVFTNSSCPITLGIGAPGDITCLVLTGLEANPTSSFSTGSQWIQINPQIRKPVTQTWLQARQFFYTDQGIVGKQYDTLPLRKRANLVGFINPRPFYFIQPTSIPLNQGISWPNPAPKRKYNPSWLDYYLLDSTSVIVTAPSKYQYDVLIPGKVPIRSYAGWIDYRIFDTNVPAQPTQNIWNNPVRRRFQTQTWLQNSLTSSVVGLPPIGENIFELPRIAKKQAITFLQVSNSLTAPIPVGLSEFTNPRIAIRLGLSYIQNRPFFYEEPLFNTVPVLDVPVVVRRVQAGFIFNAQIQETTPILFTDYPNPVLSQKLAETWIQNLLQSTLTPTPGETPFNQTDYPNPLLKGKSQDWTWSRPQYYTDSIAFRQNDWPNPRYGRRNNPVLEVPRFFFIEQPISPFLQFNFPNPILKNKIALTFINDILRFTLNPFPVGQSVYNNPTIGVRNRELLTFITSQNPNLAELPIIRNTDFPVPLRVAVYSRGFTDNPLAVITIIPGTQPFNQSEWPLFLRIKRNRVDYNQNKPIVLPDIVGRIICLDADATEYDLEATIDGFDLDAQETDYDLEAGGQDCE